MSTQTSQEQIQNPFAGKIAILSARREAMLSEGKFSLPQAAGCLAIIVSGVDSQGHASADERRIFMAEAEKAKERYTLAGSYAGIQIIDRATADIFRQVLGDPEVAGVVTIGNGNISAMVVEGDYPGYWWNDAAQAATHLKQGDFVQAMCGHFPIGVEYHVPLGTFVVRTFSSIRAAAGKIFPNGALMDHDRLLQPILDDVLPLAQQLDALNERHLGRKQILNAAGEVVRIIKHR